MSAYLQETSTPSSTTAILAEAANRQPEPGDQEARVARGRLLFMGMDGTDSVAEKQGGIGCIGCHTNLNETGQHWITNDLIKSGTLATQLTSKLGHIPSATELSAAARTEYQAMSYNQRQWYAMEHFPGPAASGKSPAYPDGSPKPVFQAFGPELSGIGTKLLAGRSQEQAVRWLYRWLIDPTGHYPNTIMPRARLLAQTGHGPHRLPAGPATPPRIKDDPWRAMEISADPDKISFLVSQFLLSQFDAATAQPLKADDDGEL